MKCIILAAGYATRLYPLTENFPKPLLEVAGKSILDWLIEDIDTAGTVDEYVVVSNHKFAAHFEKWAGERNASRRFEAPVTVLDDGTSTNETRLGAVCDIKFAVDSRGIDDELLVIAGDNLLDFSLKTFLDYARTKGTSCVMRYSEPDEARLQKCAVACVDGDDLITSLEEKPSRPRSHWACPPFYYYTRENAAWIGRGIESGCGTDAPGSYLAWLCANAPVHAMAMPGKRYDIGNLESYHKVQQTFDKTLKK